MKEIRLHGRGGLGVVKASQLVVRAAVEGFPNIFLCSSLYKGFFIPL